MLQWEVIRFDYVMHMLRAHLLRIMSGLSILDRPMLLTVLFTITLVQFFMNAMFFNTGQSNACTLLLLVLRCPCCVRRTQRPCDCSPSDFRCDHCRFCGLFSRMLITYAFAFARMAVALQNWFSFKPNSRAKR